MDWLREKYKTLDIMTGYEKVSTPEIIKFMGCEKACDILKRHIEKVRGNNAGTGGIEFLIHADVDVDGISSAYIMYKFLSKLVPKSKEAVCINSERVHGIDEKQVKSFNKHCVGGLVIIVDSSSKCEEYVKNINADVLVLDHHNLDGTEQLVGKTVGGEYAIINNNANNDDSITDMSGAEVVYEFLRDYQARYMRNEYDILYNERLFQWVAMSLYTDVIDTDTPRNQWFIEKGFDNKIKLEDNLGIMCEKLNKWQKGLDKSFINFTFASLINSNIRAGASSDVINVVCNHPENIEDLLKSKEIQKEVLRTPIDSYEYSTFILADITETGIGAGYCGLLATRMLGNHKKTSVVYIAVEQDGKMYAKGSFRGLSKNIKYQEELSMLDKCIAEGHSNAFGFTVPYDDVANIMAWITREDVVRDRELVTMGNLVGIPCGEHHYKDGAELKKDGLLYKISMVNSRVNSDSAINIICSNDNNVRLVEQKGRLFIYDVYGLECKAFEELKSSHIEVYAEYKNEMELYARPKSV